MRRVCVSACLLGVPCRWKGDAKPCEEALRLARDANDAPTGGMEVIPFCPETAAGFGCPRPPIQLVRTDDGIRVLRVDGKGDATDALRAACEAQADALARSGGVDAFLLKSRSPSCGLASPLHDGDGREIGTAPGLWAALARARFPTARFRDETGASPALPARTPQDPSKERG